MLWCFQIFARKFFHEFQNKKKRILKTISRGKYYIRFFIRNFFKKKGFAQVLPVNGNIYFIIIIKFY